MCGIAGEFRFDGAPVDPTGIAAMLGRLPHRGPDATRSWTGRAVAFGHTRLSIIDPEGSDQPMATADGRLHLTFNGEILNYRELRSSLGGSFRTRGDTEVLLRSFEQAGPDAVPRLRGQFAFAVHDTEADELHLFRDRMGILPLYYAVDGDRLVFASEIKALLAVLPRPQVDTASLHDYLTHRSVQAPFTLFDGIRKLLPGHGLLARRDGSVRITPYWALPDRPAATSVSPHEAVEQVDRTLRDAVADAFVADVPVGSYLSGGVDSSLVVALAAQHRRDAPLSTYSAGFTGSTDDERPFARRVAELFRTDHHEVLVGPEDFNECWNRLTWHRDAPLSEPADVARFRLAERAGQDVRVVLSGEGSDELFAGYPKYGFATVAERLARIPHAVRGPVLTAVSDRLPARFSRAGIALRAVAARDPGERLRTWFAPFDDAQRTEMLGPPLRAGRPWYDVGGPDPVHRMLYADAHGWLADNLLESGDRMSMAASVEIRPPFLDARLVDLAFSLPSSVKLRGGVTKWAVKEVARRHLPGDLVDRRKVGFRVPLRRWFQDHLREEAWDTLTAPGAFVGEIIPRSALLKLLSAHDSGVRNEDIRLWTLLGLEKWHEVFLRPDPTPGPVVTGSSGLGPGPRLER